MNFLWKKEPNSHFYLDLFETLPDQVHDEFDKIKNKVKTSQKCKSLVKDNEKSLAFRTSGNDCFKEKDWAKAMTWYNKSLCFAENGSENISIAYANRSSCFLRMKMYAKCLVDIELAKKANYPEHLMPKLLKRQKDCMELIENGSPDESESYCPTLDYEENPKFPGMANVLEIKRNKEFGRMIVAKRDIPVGQTVLMEKAFSTHSFGLDNCHVCSKSVMNFVPCEHCAWAVFCHDKCAQENFMHQLECGESLVGIRELEQCGFDAATDFSNVRMGGARSEEYFGKMDFLKHTFLQALKVFPNAECLMEFVEDAVLSKGCVLPNRVDTMESKCRAILQLNIAVPHMERELIYLLQAYRTYNYLLLHEDIQNEFDTEQKKRFLMHLIFHLNLAIFLNGFSTDDGSVNAFVLFSYLNHACVANLSVISRANMRFGINLRPIKAGQQIFISYLTDTFGDVSVEETQEQIYKNFGFRCNKCERCKPDERLWTENATAMKMDSDYNFLTLQSWEWKKEKDGRSEKEKQKLLKEKTLGILNRYGGHHWCEELSCIMEYYNTFFFEH